MSKDAVLSVRVTQAFRARLHQEAERRGLSLSELLLTAALRELGWGDRIRVTYHHEDGMWWADSDDVPGYYAGAQTIVEKIQRIRSRTPDFVTELPPPSTWYVVPSPSGDGTYVQQVGPMTWASGKVEWNVA